MRTSFDTSTTRRFELAGLRERLSTVPHGQGRPLPNPKLGQGWTDASREGGYRVTEFALRGSRRFPVQVFQTKGFRPKEQCFRPEQITSHDPLPHVTEKGPQGDKDIGSLFVSFSRSLRVAKHYSEENWVYVARLRAAVDINAYMQATGINKRASSQELLAYVVVLWKDILAYRHLPSGKVWTNSQFDRLNLTDDVLENAIRYLCTGAWQ